MKMIISSSTPALDRVQKASNSEKDENDTFRLSLYLHRRSGFVAKTNAEEVSNDHAYVRPPNLRPEFVFAKPLRTLFVHPSNESNNGNKEEDIDVEKEEPTLPPLYDKAKAMALMGECEEHVSVQHPDEGNPDWEDYISKINWSNMQTQLFSNVVKVLNMDRLARLAHTSDANEPLLCRLTVDKTARRLRQILASVTWQTKYTQWLHNILVDNLPVPYLVSYLDAMQTLKAKVPVLVERMLAGSSTRSTLAAPNHELLSIIHKRPWDPLSSGIPQYKPRKLPRDPILVMVPSSPGTGNMSRSRTHHWMSNLTALGTVVCVYSTPGRMTGKVTAASCLEHMLSSTRAKVAELHADYGNRPIVLVGIGTGAALACQVALLENITAVVCLGFPLYTAHGNRGMPDDTLLNIQVPLLFVVGQDSSTCSVSDLEDMREKLNVVTSMVLVGGADDHLRLSKAKKKLDRVTQSMVDKCIIDEVADFLGTLLSPDYVPPVRPTIVHQLEPPPKRIMTKTVERKRKCDMVMQNSSDSLALIPAKKGRKPKLTMTKKIVQNRWASQMSKGEMSLSSALITTPATQNMSMTSRVVEKKGLQFTSLQLPVASVSAPSTSSNSTITVVAASSPSFTAASAVKSRLAKGQLTSLTSLLQPGTRGVLSTGSINGGGEEKLITIKGLAQTSSTAPDLSEELNILDMPVILGDQNPEDTILSQLQPQHTSPVKLILTSASARPTMKLVSQPTTRILISKANSSKTVIMGGSTRGKSRIRHIPATKNQQLF